MLLTDSQCVTELTDSTTLDRFHLISRDEGTAILNPCWVLIVTRGLRVWLPPEVYLNRDLAIRESARWSAVLGLQSNPTKFSSRVRCPHLVETEFPDSWRACPVWVGVSWNERTSLGFDQN